MQKFFSAIFLLIVFLFSNTAVVFAQVAPNKTANDFNSVVPYNGIYAYGSNMGYYGSQFTDQDVSQLAYDAGSRSVRLSLPDWLITGYGTTSRLSAFHFYQNIGLKDLTVFVGEPNDGVTHGASGADDRETITFPGASERAKTFKGLYEPIWLDSAKTQINPANTFASYLYKTVTTYGPYVKFWEVINEPDFTYGANGWSDSSSPTSWWNVNPSPNELENMKAPVFYYIRELHVAYDVIKTLQPNEYVATGGIGYPSFLDAILRNTDNPADGSVTTQYPLKGGAYFDVLSFHSYPMYSLRYWSNAIMNFVYTRNSDAAVDNFLKTKTDFATVLQKYGYNGTTFPQKQWINTETDLPQKQVGDAWGSVDSANNYIIKAHVLGQANGVSQIYKYGLGENGTSSTDVFNTMGVYGDIGSSSTTISNAPKTEQFKAVQTLSTLLYGKNYDSTKTSQLALPSGVRGAAFRDSNNVYTYVLWAQTKTDLTETASASYTFPFSFSGTRREWDFSATNQTSTASGTVALTGVPSFFTDSNAVVNPQNNNNNTNYIAPYNPSSYTYYGPQLPNAPQIVSNYPLTPPSVNAGADKNLSISNMPLGLVSLIGTGSDSDGTVPNFFWSEVSGPNNVQWISQNTSNGVALGLVSGKYVFRLTATDNHGVTASDDVVVNVSGGSSSQRISTTASRLNVRSTPGGTILRRVPYGTVGTVIDRKIYGDMNWDNVTFDNGLIGWVSDAYVQMN